MNRVNRATLLELPAKDHPELLAAWELVPRHHELFHAGQWRRLVEVQPVGLVDPEGREVYLILDGPLVERTASRIDRETGAISKFSFTVRSGPVLIRPLSSICRARVAP